MELRLMRKQLLAAGAVAYALIIVTGCESGDGNGTALVETLPALELDQVHVTGTDASVATVRDLEVLSDGTVWLLNSVEPFFVGFDPAGALIQAHGEAGGGPEEFLFPSAFVTGGIDGQAWVLDLRRHSLIKISEPDGAWSEVPLPRDSIPPGSLRGGMSMMSTVVRTASMGDELLLPRTTGSMESGIFDFRLSILAADLLAMDKATQSVREVVALGEVLDDLTVDFDRMEGGFPLWFRLWAVCGDDQLHVYDRVRNEIRAFGRDGTEVGATALPPVRFTEATPRQFARAVFGLRAAEVAGAVGRTLTAADSTRLLNEMIQDFDGNPRQLASYLPQYVDFRCSDDGTRWLQPFDLDAGGLEGGPDWLRLTSGGLTQPVRFPDRFDPFRFTRDRAWGVQRDDLDVASVAWVELPSAR